MEMNQIIPPEIIGDDFARALTSIVAAQPIRSIVEIGASSGDGSTAALVAGMETNTQARLYSIEASKERFALLQRRYADNPRVTCINAFSVPLGEWYTPDNIDALLLEYSCGFSSLQIKGWLQEEIEYSATNSDVPQDGITQAATRNGDRIFDLALIDGSLFTGSADLNHVYGAKFIALDDVRSMKNGAGRKMLAADTEYELYACGTARYGWQIFRRLV